MPVSYELIKRRLCKVKNDEELAGLGFEKFSRLEEHYPDRDVFERLWVATDEGGKSVVFVDLGSSQNRVIGFMEEIMEKGEVFKEEDGHLVGYTNTQYHSEEKERAIWLEHVLGAEREGVAKLLRPLPQKRQK